jgi:hypothetical protein
MIFVVHQEFTFQLTPQAIISTELIIFRENLSNPSCNAGMQPITLYMPQWKARNNW